MKKRVLIADDEPHFRFGVATALRIAGYEIWEASSGVEALQFLQVAAAKGEPVDLLLLDIRMPGMSGLDLIATVRRLGLRVQTFIVSGYFDPTQYPELAGGDVVGFLAKPFEPQELLHQLHDVFTNRRGPVGGDAGPAGAEEGDKPNV